jgi:putative FmdB family regulatory protein
LIWSEVSDMPIYEYQCKTCDHRCEVLRKISDEALTTCPECGKETLIKLMSASGFRLKGQGWYETDFKSGNKKNLAEGSSKNIGKASAEKKTSSSSK